MSILEKDNYHEHLVDGEETQFYIEIKKPLTQKEFRFFRQQILAFLSRIQQKVKEETV